MRDAIERLPAGTPVYVAERSVAEEIVGFDMHRGVLALGERGETPPLEAVVGDARCVLVLEGLSNHDNVGSLYRSLSALGPGQSAVVLGPGCADPFYRKSLRVSMGHVLRVPTAWAADWPGDLDVFGRDGFRTLALTPDPEAPAIESVGLRCPPDRVALLLGAEGPGLTDAAMSAASQRVRIPMNEGSYGASDAGSVVRGSKCFGINRAETAQRAVRMRGILTATIVALAASAGLAQSDQIIREGSGERRAALDAMELSAFDKSLLGGLTDWIGEPVTADDLDGKPVLILTWASWHSGSTASARAAELVAKRYADQGLVVIG
ncbi:Uncharacterized tRNA/rRNA methyltransferase MT0904, partial [Durusdinium trenchii]